MSSLPCTLLFNAYCLALLLATPGFAQASILVVPDDYPTINRAISCSQAGDTILVKPGTYFEMIDFAGREITVRSMDGPKYTAIDGMKLGSVVTFSNKETPAACLDGFTIKNGTGNLMTFYRQGGGICICNGSSPTIMNNLIDGNSADWGGGICCIGALCKSIIFNNKITYNKATVFGGGIFCEYSSPDIIGNSLHCNDSLGGGGGIFLRLGGSAKIDGNYITSNYASEPGGGIGTTNGPTPQITNNIVAGNQARDGGGILLYRGLIQGNIIRNNAAATMSGGGLCGYGGGISVVVDTKIVGNLIIDNIALSMGGVVIVSAASELRDNVILGNYAGGSSVWKSGGGIAVLDCYPTPPTICNCVLMGNGAEDQGGGVYITHHAAASMFNNSLISNAAPVGSGVYSDYEGELTATNCIFWDDPDSEIHYETIKSIITYSDVCGGYDGEGNMDADPSFVNPSENDWHLLLGSPCLNAGTNLASLIPDKDIDGNSRILDDSIDIGADEYGRHLYLTGDTLPEGNLDINFIGYPLNEVTLFASLGQLPEPIRTPFGTWYLDDPFVSAQVGFIPYDGHLVLHVRIPSGLAIPMDVFAQSLIRNELTDCAVLKLRASPF